MSNTLQPPKRPKPVMPWANAVVAAAHAGVSAMYFIEHRPGFGTLWATMAVAWAFMVRFALGTHRIQVRTWYTQVRTHQRLRALDDERRMWLAIPDDRIGDAP